MINTNGTPARIVTYGITVGVCFLIMVYGLIEHSKITNNKVAQSEVEKEYAVEMEKRRGVFLQQVEEIEDCLEIVTTRDRDICSADEDGIFRSCDEGFDHRFLTAPTCSKYNIARIQTPENIKALYMSSYVAGSPGFRERLLSLVDRTELNSVMIDVKEVDGLLTSSEFKGVYPGVVIENRIPKLRTLLHNLRDREIYSIARIVVFKDAYMTGQHPQWAVKKLDQESVWKDYGGKTYIDPGAQEYWDYIVALADRAYTLGFDEVNLDYIRYPSDGNMKTDWYPYSQELIDTDPQLGRSRVLDEFHTYFHDELRDRHPEIVTSADVFGMVATSRDDLSIGQLLEPFLQHYDYVAPMVYPSHYPVGFLGLSGHPDAHPYTIINYSMKEAVKRAEVLDPTYSQKLRPWLQDFTCTWCEGYIHYGAAQVRAQIQGVSNAGLDSWMLWDAANTYTEGALLRE